MNKFSSLCILGYKRPEQLEACIQSIHATIDEPCEIILNMDAANSSVESLMIAEEYFHLGKISKLVLSGGKNRGVGRSFENCLGVAEGAYIFKIDADLTFRPAWLSTAIEILEIDPNIAAVSLFNYKHYNPNETRFNILEERYNCYIVDDFVSSIFGFRAEEISGFSPIPDDGLHQIMAVENKKLAITLTDFVSNSGFGLGKSTYVVPDNAGNPVKATTYDTPLLFTPLDK